MKSERIKLEQEFWDTKATDSNVDQWIIDHEISLQKCVDMFKDDLEKKKKVLEIGSGVGRLTNALAKLMPKTKFIAVDISTKMHDIAMERAKALQIENITYFKTTGRSLPIDKIDAAYSMVTFQHIPADGVKEYFKNLGKVMKKNGIFKFQFVEGTEQIAFSHNFSMEEITDWLDAAGFKITNIRKGEIVSVWTWITCKKK